MEIIVKEIDCTYRYEIPFSIGDIVTVISYDCRFYDLNIYILSNMYHGELPKNAWKYTSIEYDSAVKKYAKLQWKIDDIGVLNKNAYDLIVKLVNREGEVLLIGSKSPRLDMKLNLIRKSKKQCTEHVIDLT